MERQTLAQMSTALHEGSVTSRELTEASLTRIAQLNPQLNAFITITGDRALAAADAADQLLAKGKAGPLVGIPLAHKDIFCTRDVLTTCGSKMLSNFVSPYDAGWQDQYG